MRGTIMDSGGEAPFGPEDSFGWGMLIGFSGDGEEHANADAFDLLDEWGEDPLQRP